MAKDAYTPEEPKTLHLFDEAIPSEEVAEFLEKLIPLILACTESGGGSLIQFERSAGGQFYLLFQNHIGDFRAISSGDPRWLEKVRDDLGQVLAEKDLSDTLPMTDFEDARPRDIPESKSR